MHRDGKSPAQVRPARTGDDTAPETGASHRHPRGLKLRQRPAGFRLLPQSAVSVECCSQRRKKIGKIRVRKPCGHNQGHKPSPVERGGNHVRGDMVTAHPAFLDIAGKYQLLVPEKSGPADHPLITPSGTKRATRREIPASCTTLTTSSLGL